MDFKGKRVAIVGMARSGIGAAKLVNRLGGAALVSDIKKAQDLTNAIEELQKFGIEIETESHQRLLQEHFDLVVLSPGVIIKPDLWKSWKDKNIKAISELELVSRLARQKWIGVTGSNGKTTTVNLIHQILVGAGFKTLLVGNVGEAWSNHVPADAETNFVVEVSSFQLENSPTVKPAVGAILNVFENHLDRHGTIENYAEIKSRLLLNQDEQDIAVLNGEDVRLQNISKRLRSRILWFGIGNTNNFWVGTDGLYFKSGVNSELFLPNQEFPLPGMHNRLNALAAAASAYAFGVNMTQIAAALKKAKPVEHRIEFVREINGVRYFNDSKSTNLIATLTALESFSKNVILLFGGKAKKESFKPLASKYPVPVKALLSYGESRLKLKEDLPAGFPITEFETLEASLKTASDIAQRGDTVLLSPGCASYDQFENFEQRGLLYKTLVNQL